MPTRALWHGALMDTDPTARTDSPGSPADPERVAVKRALRTQLRARRRELYGTTEGARRREREGQQLLEHAAPLLEMIATAAARSARDGSAPVRVSAFHPTPTEADVMPLAAALARSGAEVLFPVAAGRELDWAVWDGSSPFMDSPGRGFGKEPEGPRRGTDALSQVSLILAPALAVDRSGTRLGHGGGYYDRALRHAPEEVRIIAVINPDDLLPTGTLPRDAHDVPVPEVLTAAGLEALG